jgi:putative nucleotidyltransferase with HDIG domain
MTTKAQESIEQIVGELQELKLFPPAAARILRLANNPVANLRSIEQAVKLDPILSARVLKIANSAYYGAPHRVATLGQALGVMGFQPAREMAVALAIGSIETKGVSPSRNLWEHSMKTAVTSRLLGRYVKNIDNNALFIAGLLHDIGQTLLYAVKGKEYATLAEKFKGDYNKLVLAERFAYKFDHAQLGAQCLKQWNLPDLTVNIIEHHHVGLLEKPQEPHLIGAYVIQLAESVISLYERGIRGPKLINSASAHPACLALELTTPTLEVVVDLITEEFQALSSLY